MDTTTTTSRIKDRITEGRRQIEAQVAALRERAVPLLAQVKHRVEDGVAEVKHRMEDGVAEVKHRMEDGVAEASIRLSHWKGAEALRDVAARLGWKMDEVKADAKTEAGGEVKVEATPAEVVEKTSDPPQ